MRCLHSDLSPDHERSHLSCAVRRSMRAATYDDCGDCSLTRLPRVAGMSPRARAACTEARAQFVEISAPQRVTVVY
jgi:hypothetical protein